MEPLPIDGSLPELLAALATSPGAVLEAPPGAGKTTRVPGAILDAGLAGAREVIVLEPRRLAARLAARRVAEERGGSLGDEVGYQVRFEDHTSARTRIRFVTEGVLTRRLLVDPTLDRVGAVLLDEFHERHLHGDVALALLRRLQRTKRPDLRVVAMSATLDGASVASFLGDPAPRVRAEGRRFDVAIEYLPRADDRPLAALVALALRQLVSDGLDGDVLVFLPGAAEIRRCMETCADVASRNDLMVLPLHGELPVAEQDRAVQKAARRKVILSTNVAETSVTIDGVVAVIDSGLARVASHAPWSGLPVLKVAKVSKASATQRAGRAGRTRPGRCLRLYTKGDHDVRPDHDAPEIQRMDLAETALELHAAGVADLLDFGWFEAPSTASVTAADTLLRALGAITDRNALTDMGRAMLRAPLHPRLARVVFECERMGLRDEGATLAAILGERELVSSRRAVGLHGGAPGRRSAEVHSDSDLLSAMERFDEARASNFEGYVVRGLGLDMGAVQAVERSRKQLARSGGRDRSHHEPSAPADRDEALRQAVLMAYPDRVARRVGDGRYALVGGGAASLAAESEVQNAEFLVAVDAESRSDPRARGVLIRSATAIEPEWLLERFPDAVTEVAEAKWDAEKQRVDAVLQLRYEGLVLDETKGATSPLVAAKVSSRLLEEARKAGTAAFVRDPEALDRWIARVTFLAGAMPELKVRVPNEQDLDAALATLCEGRASFAALREAGLFDALQDTLDAPQRRALDQHAPERVTLPGGRNVRVQYDRARPPWIESRLQDFFGLADGPRVAAGRVPLVLHLLAPNQRAVQVTTDLKGFWERHYPGIRKELCRKYPRHAWPDDGRTATPPAPRR